MIYVKKLRRKCSVKGCRCTDTYNVSVSSEPGGSVIICRKCAEAAAKAIEKYEKLPAEQRKRPILNRPAPPLFFHAPAQPEEPAETLHNVKESVSELVGYAQPEEVTEVPEEEKTVQKGSNKNRTKNSK